MPHLLFRGVPAPGLRSLAPELVQELAVLCDCGVDNFTIECLATTSIYGGLPMIVRSLLLKLAGLSADRRSGTALPLLYTVIWRSLSRGKQRSHFGPIKRVLII